MKILQYDNTDKKLYYDLINLSIKLNIDYSKQYFTTEILETGSISFSILKSIGTEYIESISYSLDNGNTWITTENTDDKQGDLVITINAEENDIILWKGIAKQLAIYNEDADDYIGLSFSSEIRFNVYGNIMSLLYGDDFIGKTEFKSDSNHQFSRLFSDYYGEKECNIMDASNLILPVLNLSEGCYVGMFQGCTSLITAPELPATTLAVDCYSSMFYECTSLTKAPKLSATTLASYCCDNMFYGCSSLIEAPELPATTLVDNCYGSMFQGCTSLTKTPELPATTLAKGCYSFMFEGCTSLTSSPELPATTLAENCYSNMFNGCTSLIKAPELNATTLAEYCYEGMFAGCTSLVTAPELPATTLARYCYRSMFSSCTSLATAPELLATTLLEGCYYDMFNNCSSLIKAPELTAATLVESCYSSMFNGCTKLNYIKALFTTTPSNSYTSNWVLGVAATGTFVKNSNATWNEVGTYAVPQGWTIETANK